VYSLAESDPPILLEDRGDPLSRAEILDLACQLHGRALFRFLLRITLGDRREAEDLLQETLLRAWRYLQDHTADPQSLRPWLFTVARHLSIDASRARQTRPTEVVLQDLTVLSDPRDETDRTLNALAMRPGLRKLTQDHRRVIFEVYYHGRSAREAAEVIGVPEGTVKSRLFYALKALGAALPHEADIA